MPKHRTPEQKFMTGQPVVYFGLDGMCYSAKFIPARKVLEIRTCKGKLVASAIMSDEAAQLFVNNLRGT